MREQLFAPGQTFAVEVDVGEPVVTEFRIATRMVYDRPPRGDVEITTPAELRAEAEALEYLRKREKAMREVELHHVMRMLYGNL